MRKGIWICGGVLAMAVVGQAQVAAIPATAPTQGLSPSDLPSAHPALTSTPAGSSSVSWSGASMTITSGGATLRSILREVSRTTGMKITGGVPDEPVFGKYGPGSVQDVLSDLFDGLSVNMMLINGTPVAPKEMILTARTGGPTPPSSRPMSDDDSPPQQIAQPGPALGAPRGRYTPPPAGFGGPPPRDQPSTIGAQGLNNGATGNETIGAAGQNNGVNAYDGIGAPAQQGTPVDASGNPASPNGVRTPEQIFEELRKRQAAQSGSTQ